MKLLPNEPAAPAPTETADIDVFVEVLINEKVPATLFTTYRLIPSGLSDTLTGPGPSGNVDISVLVAVLTTEILFELKFATYIKLAFRFRHIPTGLMPLT